MWLAVVQMLMVAWKRSIELEDPVVSPFAMTQRERGVMDRDDSHLMENGDELNEVQFEVLNWGAHVRRVVHRAEVHTVSARKEEDLYVRAAQTVLVDGGWSARRNRGRYRG